MWEHSLEELLEQSNIILDREGTALRDKPVIEAAEPILKRVVDFGAAFYAVGLRDLAQNKIHKPALALYYQILQMTDGIQVLVSGSCVEAAIPLSRSALEAAFSLDFLFQQDYEYRSRVWRYFCLRRNLQCYDPDLQDDAVQQALRRYGYCERIEAQGELSSMRKQLEDPEFSQLHKEFKDKRPRNWFAWVKDGPGDFRKLFERLDKHVMYHTVYADYSRKAHANVYPMSRHLRYPGATLDMVFRAEQLMDYATWKMIENLLPDLKKAFEEYHTEIQKKISELSRISGC